MVIAFIKRSSYAQQTDRFRRLRHLFEGGRAGKLVELADLLGLSKQQKVRVRRQTNTTG